MGKTASRSLNIVMVEAVKVALLQRESHLPLHPILQIIEVLPPPLTIFDIGASTVRDSLIEGLSPTIPRRPSNTTQGKEGFAETHVGKAFAVRLFDHGPWPLVPSRHDDIYEPPFSIATAHLPVHRAARPAAMNQLFKSRFAILNGEFA